MNKIDIDDLKYKWELSPHRIQELLNSIIEDRNEMKNEIEELRELVDDIKTINNE